jgi:hypothetical protein
MTITIDLPLGIEGELRRRTADAGQDVDAFATSLIERALRGESILSEFAGPLFEEDEDEDSRPWRGVYTPAIPEQVLFTTPLQLKMGTSGTSS